LNSLTFPFTLALTAPKPNFLRAAFQSLINRKSPCGAEGEEGKARHPTSG